MNLIKNMHLRTSQQTIVFSITNRCNAKCATCFLNNADDIELNSAEIRQIIDKINRYFIRKPYFLITGGEPFMRADIVEILGYMSQNKIGITSALHDVPLSVLDNIPKNTDLSISLHGPPDIHDKITGIDGLYSKTMKTLKYLKKKETNLKINCIVSKYNTGRLVEFYKSIRYLKIPINFQHLIWIDKEHSKMQKNMALNIFGCNFVNHINNDHCTIPQSKIMILENELKEIKRISNGRVSEVGLTGDYIEHYCTYNLRKKHAHCIEHILRIQPDGTIRSCMGPIFGKILHNSLNSILDNANYVNKQINELFRQGQLFPICVKCCKLRTDYFGL